MSADRNLASLGFIGGFAIGLSVGAGVMYLFDPEEGRRRRALIRDRAVHLGHETEHFAESRSRHIGNRARGFAAKARRAAGLMPNARREEERAENAPEASA